MAALLNPIVSVGTPRTKFLSGSSLMSIDQCLSSNKLLISQGKAHLKCSRSLKVRAGADSGRPSSTSIFLGGFILGGLLVGTLGCVYAPQISKVLVGDNRKELMRKLPKFIYDEEKALEKTRKVLTHKIEQLNAAIDEISAQLRASDGTNGAADVATPDEHEASV